MTYLQELYSVVNIVHITTDIFEKTTDTLLYVLFRFMYSSFMDDFDLFSLLCPVTLSKKGNIYKVFAVIELYVHLMVLPALFSG